MSLWSRIKEIRQNLSVAVPVREKKPVQRPEAAPNLPSGVKAANEAINAGLVQDVVQDLPPVTHPPTRVSQAGIDLLHAFEGFHRDIGGGRVKAYPDPATGGEPYTIGYGSTGRDPFNGGKIGPGTIWTHDQANQRFLQHLRQFEREVSAMIKVPTTQSQFDAIVSLAYNVGTENVRKSTLLRLHNAGNHDAAQQQFKRWNRAAGKVMAGLTRRRLAEADLYGGGK